LVEEALRLDRERAKIDFITRDEQKVEVGGLQQQAERMESSLRSALGNLSADAATKHELEWKCAAIQEAVDSLQLSLAGTATKVKDAARSLSALQEHCATSLATQEYAYETARSLAYHAVRESDEKQQIVQLRREFEDEQERSRQIMRQVQVSRRDLSDMIEISQETREHCASLGKTCSHLTQLVEDLDGREAEHWAQAQASVSRQGHAHEQLEAFHRALREEFMSHTEIQRREAEKLRSYSTHRYLEQMDKALDLHKSLESVTLNHKELTMGQKELSEAVRSIKLPKVLIEPGGKNSVT